MDSSTRTTRIGCVSFLNAKPLIFGLENDPRIDLSLDVPSGLLGGLAAGRFDAALLPVIDYQRLAGLTLVPAGGIGCDGPTLTVRIFSRQPIDRIATLACDGDSHTSIALARILLAEQFGIRPEFVPLAPWAAERSPEIARLLIGDKVVCNEPAGFPHQLDLGELWKRATGLPFVFAAWMSRPNVDGTALAPILERARQQGLSHVDQLIDRHAKPAGWPADIARKYLTQYLQYDIGPRELDAIRRFHQLAFRHGLIDHEPWALRISTESKSIH